MSDRIGGSEESVMGIKPQWTVEWRDMACNVWHRKVDAYTIVEAIDVWRRVTNGEWDIRYVLGVRRD